MKIKDLDLRLKDLKIFHKSWAMGQLESGHLTRLDLGLESNVIQTN